ncbi:hypothetical protein [Nocardioides marmotae]|uniref:Uncharacterized protein n=1 Tax=Nocardioides marmotae TaxID=2663857 RepID=A0A6I3JFE4_9ACTN|nr:hypothetical protein [Nocardioides marmotae]MCR6033186.1 hypothetical protein [Gordonia jinghuaiqii]MBC9732692.1 hypothetical protein [Nocardioides marmotae]MTB83809.1 hypothetical protein [Nocardioides marmotae]MTB96841.1 hypothetical protein [Nocardioides marmotae]QKE02959.1 hypothetical protein HPC71_19280 [Nocardioides marmotae]
MPPDQPSGPPTDKLGDQRPDRPVLSGLIALVGVGLVVGLVLGGVALGAVSVLGLGGDDGGSGRSSDQQAFYLPKPQPTDEPDGPLITLAPEPGGDGSASAEPSESATTEAAEDEISLSAGQASVTPMQQIDLTGVYTGGEGAILQVQRFADGTWVDFPVTASVSNEMFSTYIQTGQLGENKFRVVDTSTGLESNEVTVTIG